MFLRAKGDGVLRVDIGIKVFVADSDGDVNVIDIVEGVGVALKLAFDEGEEIVFGKGCENHASGIVGILCRFARDVEVERVMVFLIVEGDDGLIASSSWEGVPFQFTAATYDETKLMTSNPVRIGQDILDRVARSNFLGEESNHGGESRSKGVSGRVAKDDKLENTSGVLDKTLAWDTIIDGLGARWEIALGLTRTLGIGQLPTVDELIGGGKAVVIASDAFPSQQVDGNVARQVIVGVGNGRIVVEIVLAEIATLHTGPDGVLLGVEHTIDRRNVTPRGVGAEIDLARREGKQKDG